ncbi:hypothetical protein [Methylobacterium soli]|uniref:Uncharacterized protein n=1 Tax=Methylobacterium soli TaxID=553447 RepID=A0A6L3SUY5_9HYPH|nr:hypothetical protein [Methylobacterium soli]KAB1068762.1 hypothetical protein F6X53_31350 [Methylobacterium soli]GJE41502.1 hypothetical protein AEGHOMDF_0668 [Methylobacterium soli]
MTQDDLLDAVERRIAQGEAHSTALTAAIIGLTRAGCDATEFETMLRDIRSILAPLRRQQWAIPARATNP